MATLGRMNGKKEDVIKAAMSLYNQGLPIMVVDVMNIAGTKKVFTSQILNEFYAEHKEFDTPQDRQARNAERTKRMQQGRRAKDFPALKAQAERGYDNLVIARQRLAEKRAKAKAEAEARAAQALNQEASGE